MEYIISHVYHLKISGNRRGEVQSKESRLLISFFRTWILTKALSRKIHQEIYFLRYMLFRVVHIIYIKLFFSDSTGAFGCVVFLIMCV